MSTDRPVIMWFRQDLRLSDNLALSAAIKTGSPVLPLFVLDDDNANEWKIGSASRWWLHHSLTSLNSSLDGQLRLMRGNVAEILPELARSANVSHVFWNRCYEPWRIARDRLLMQKLRDDGVTVSSRSGSLLFEPQSITKSDGTPYKVFTPFYRKGCLSGEFEPRHPISAPKKIGFADYPCGVPLSELELLPRIRWYDEIARNWSPGEDGARDRLKGFIDTGVGNYKIGRDRPDQNYCSRLSPHLHFGEISPHQVWQETESLLGIPHFADGVDHFRSELGWREFSYYLLYHQPQLPYKNLQKKFDRFAWRDDEDALVRWQQGRTGVPIVDAGMRQLWRTGYMHNRVRMIAASFLIKNLLIHWRHGQAWFWDTLVDADLASNSASWQWVAGTGADAAPYFRIFNPVLQGQKFDAEGGYVRKYVPELARLPKRYIHSPWLAPYTVLRDAGISAGADYPMPIVDLKRSRERALTVFKNLTAGSSSEMI